MPHTIDIEERGIVITLHGAVTGDEIFRLNRQIIEDGRFSRWRYQIWDFTGLETVEISIDQLRSFVFQDSVASRNAPHHRVAILTRRASHADLANVYHLLAREWGGYASKTFHSIKAARKWATSS